MDVYLPIANLSVNALVIIGLGGLVGTYIGAFAQKYLPEGMLRVGLALLIAVLSLTYFLQSLLAR